MSLKIRLLGVRGSLPVPLGPTEIRERAEAAVKAFLISGGKYPEQVSDFMGKYPSHLLGGYGGNTTCVEVKSGSESLLIDGGSGIVKKVNELMNGPCGRGEGEVHILMTHFHWDRMMGLPHFSPLFVKGNRIHFYAVQKNINQALQTIFRKPYFPIPYEALEAKILLHPLQPRETVSVNGFHVTPYRLDHPDECWGFRIEKEGLAYAHCADTELTRMTEAELGDDLPLYKNVDLMLFDSQYSVQEATRKVHWGHAAANFGIDLALRHGIKHMVFVNHDPALNDAELKKLGTELEKYHSRLVSQLEQNIVAVSPLTWELAQEDSVIQVAR